MELLKVFLSVSLLFIFTLFLHLYNVVWWKPERIRSKLRRQGIREPPSYLLQGNIPDIQQMRSTAKKTRKQESFITHDASTLLFPHIHHWKKQYGKIFMFSLGKAQLLCVTQPDVVKDMSLCTSLDLGKPSYQRRELGPLLGDGILTTNGAPWIHQRKVLAPELYMDKVKGMMNLMVEGINILTKSWESKIESEGGLADIKADDDLRRFSSFVISKILFGSSYAKGTEIFIRLKEIQRALSRPSMLIWILGLRHLPTKSNREIWKLEKEVHSMILKIVNERNDSTSDNDLLQLIIEGAKNGNLRGDAAQQFIVDNCKNIYLAGFETTAISASWALMLLAAYPDWQDRVRAKVVQICGGHVPDADMLRKMKMMTMVIQEAMRLYPPATIVSREALKDMEFGGIHVPEGINIWLPVLPMQSDPEIWGADVHKFNPERFANGVNTACKFPHAYMPFGVGPRVCVGQNFAMVELKLVIALILSKFSISLSPKYRHSPTTTLVVVPEFGVNLMVKRL